MTERDFWKLARNERAYWARVRCRRGMNGFMPSRRRLRILKQRMAYASSYDPELGRVRLDIAMADSLTPIVTSAGGAVVRAELQSGFTTIADIARHRTALDLGQGYMAGRVESSDADRVTVAQRRHYGTDSDDAFVKEDMINPLDGAVWVPNIDRAERFSPNGDREDAAIGVALAVILPRYGVMYSRYKFQSAKREESHNGIYIKKFLAHAYPEQRGYTAPCDWGRPQGAYVLSKNWGGPFPEEVCEIIEQYCCRARKCVTGSATMCIVHTNMRSYYAIKVEDVKVVVDAIVWEVGDVFHRGFGLPAVIYAHGGVEYFQRGLLHRFGGGPAAVKPLQEVGKEVRGYYHRGKHIAMAVVCCGIVRSYEMYGNDARGSEITARKWAAGRILHVEEFEQGISVLNSCDACSGVITVKRRRLN